MFKNLGQALLREGENFLKEQLNQHTGGGDQQQQQHHEQQQQQQQPPPQEHYEQGSRPLPSYAAAPHDGSKRRALFIGINYVGSGNELRGCHNDVAEVRKFVEEHFQGAEEVVLLDAPGANADTMPTRQNIENAMRWLVRDAQPGDHFFFHYSGHGSQVPTPAGMDGDGEDETIVPLDYKDAGQIPDRLIHDIMAAPLPAGSQLTAIFDCCHSGSIMNLAYTYRLDSEGQVVEIDNRVAATKEFLKAGFAYFRGNKKEAVSDAIEGAKFLWKEFQGRHKEQSQAMPQTHEAGLEKSELSINKLTRGTVIQFSGCKDEQTSADASIGGRASGALSWAFIKAVRSNPNISCHELLADIRRSMNEGHFEQIPQLASGSQVDMKQAFSL